MMRAREFDPEKPYSAIGRNHSGEPEIVRQGEFIYAWSESNCYFEAIGAVTDDTPSGREVSVGPMVEVRKNNLRAIEFVEHGGAVAKCPACGGRQPLLRTLAEIGDGPVGHEASCWIKLALE